MSYMQKPIENKNKRSIGSYYEEMAKQYLMKQGYQIKCQNFRSRFGEIDIIAQDNEYIVFIEVKYRRTMQYGYPREAITSIKKKHIRRTAEYYLFTQIRKEVPCRFDVIEILGNQLNHLKAAF